MKNNINLDISKIHTYCKQTHMYATRQVFKINKKRRSVEEKKWKSRWNGMKNTKPRVKCNGNAMMYFLCKE